MTAFQLLFSCLLLDWTRIFVFAFHPRTIPVRSGVTALHAWKSEVSTNTNGRAAVSELVSNVDVSETEQTVLLLFVGQAFAGEFEAIVRHGQAILNGKPDTVFLALLGGGVVGGNQEFDDPFGPPVMSLLSGSLPKGSKASAFSISGTGADEAISPQKSEGASHILFCDPFADIESVIQMIESGKDDVVVGGISCPNMNSPGLPQPTVALNGTPLSRGSSMGVTFTGTVGIQAVVAQGCRPIGPTFTITETTNNVLNALDGESALQQLEKVAESASNEDKMLIQRGGMLCGVTAKGNAAPGDFLIRQIMGLVKTAEGGAIAIGVNDLNEGDQFQFHIRDAAAATNDMEVMVQRAKAARLFAGQSIAGIPLAALQVSCVGRGRGLFGTANADLNQVNQLLGTTALSTPTADEDSASATNPIGGFFANGEIGPVGISGLDSYTKGTHIHGFTTVIGLLCDLSPASSEDGQATNLEAIPELESEDDAWG